MSMRGLTALVLMWGASVARADVLSVNLTLSPNPVPAGTSVATALSVSGTVPVCSGSGRYWAYLWDTDGDLVPDIAQTTSSSTISTAGLDGPVSLSVTGIIACIDPSTTIPRHYGSTTSTLLVENLPPSGSIGPVDAEVDEGESWSAEVTASDPEAADTISVSWDLGSAGTASGFSVVTSWEDDSGAGVETVVATICDDDSDCVDSSVTVSVRNVAPSLMGSPVTSAQEGVEWSFAPYATDPGADTHSWSLLEGPSAALSSASTGRVSWTPHWSELGTHVFRLQVQDDDGGADELSWSIVVTARDEDGDELPDGWEEEVGLDPTDPGDASVDVDGDGRTGLEEYQEGSDPLTDERPDLPEPYSPAEGEEVAEGPELVCIAGGSPIGDPVVHGFELALASDPSDTVWTGSTSSADRRPSVVPGNPWTENTWYVWRVESSDAYASSGWSDWSSFFYNAVQEAPSSPTLRSPLDGGVADSLSPTFLVGAAVDPDEDELTYEISLVDSFGEPVDSAGGLSISSGDLRWTPSLSLVDGRDYCWTASATDEHGLSSPTGGPNCFEVDLTNDAPSAPALLQPQDGDVLPTEPLTVEVSNGVDPEERDTVHVFELDRSPDFDSAALLRVELDTDETGTTSWPVGLLEEGEWHVRVACSDGVSASDWVSATFEIIDESGLPAAPELVSPEDNGLLVQGEPLVARPGADSDGLAVGCDFSVLDAQSGEEVVEVADVAVGEDGLCTWAPELEAGSYVWTAYTVDDLGLRSSAAIPWRVDVEAGSSGSNPRDPGQSGDSEWLDLGSLGEKAPGFGCGLLPLGSLAGGWALGLGLALRRRRR